MAFRAAGTMAGKGADMLLPHIQRWGSWCVGTSELLLANNDTPQLPLCVGLGSTQMPNGWRTNVDRRWRSRCHRLVFTAGSRKFLLGSWILWKIIHRRITLTASTLLARSRTNKLRSPASSATGLAVIRGRLQMQSRDWFVEMSMSADLITVKSSTVAQNTLRHLGNMHNEII